MKRKLAIPKTDIIRLDIGCGDIKSDGWVGMDIEDFGQEVVWDAREGIPFPDSSVSWIRMHHFLEHLTREEHVSLFGELRRVCKNQGEIYIIAPHSSVVDADYPGHLSYWDERRIQGIVIGFRDWFTIIKNERRGGELHAILKVTK